MVLFIGGMPRSGSTLLDLLLGQVPGYCDVGELYYLWSSGLVRDELCSCGAPFHECDFWQRVGKHAFGGWDQVDVGRVLALQRSVDGTGPLLRAAVLRRRQYERDVAEYLSYIEPLYEAVASVDGARVVVDSTKRPSTAFLLARSGRLDLRVVHLLRDPRGVVNSWRRKVAIPERTGPRPHLKQRSMRQILRRWITVNAMIDRLARRVPSERLRYEDLVGDPERWLRAATSVTGVAAGDEELAFLRDGPVRRVPSHTATGGRVRMMSDPFKLELDERWREELPLWRRRAIRGVAAPWMNRFGYRE
jgi:hypothetical protein